MTFSFLIIRKEKRICFTKIVTFCHVFRYNKYKTMQDFEKKVEKSLGKPSRALLNVEDYHLQAKEKL